MDWRLKMGEGRSRHISGGEPMIFHSHLPPPSSMVWSHYFKKFNIRQFSQNTHANIIWLSVLIKQSKNIKNPTMKIYTTCIVPILATFTLAEGALRITNKPNGAECTASSHCRSKCCSKVTRRSHICMSVEDGTNCVKNLRNVPGSGKDWVIELWKLYHYQLIFFTTCWNTKINRRWLDRSY